MKEFEAKCPKCGVDLVDEVSLAAGDWSEGLPSEVVVWCDDCDSEVEFRVEWHIVLWSVEVKDWR